MITGVDDVGVGADSVGAALEAAEFVDFAEIAPWFSWVGVSILIVVGTPVCPCSQDSPIVVVATRAASVVVVEPSLFLICSRSLLWMNALS